MTVSLEETQRQELASRIDDGLYWNRWRFYRARVKGTLHSCIQVNRLLYLVISLM